MLSAGSLLKIALIKRAENVSFRLYDIACAASYFFVLVIFGFVLPSFGLAYPLRQHNCGVFQTSGNTGFELYAAKGSRLRPADSRSLRQNISPKNYYVYARFAAFAFPITYAAVSGVERFRQFLLAYPFCLPQFFQSSGKFLHTINIGIFPKNN